MCCLPIQSVPQFRVALNSYFKTAGVVPSDSEDVTAGGEGGIEGSAADESDFEQGTRGAFVVPFWKTCGCRVEQASPLLTRNWLSQCTAPVS